MQKHESHLTIEDLAALVDIPVRTIRYYITEGLLPGPEGRGKATTYGEEHLQRLHLIRLLSNQRRPLAEIQQLLSRLSLNEVRGLLAEEDQHARELKQAGQQPRPQEYVASLLKNARMARQATPQEVSPRPMATPASPLPGRVYERSRVYETARAAAGESWKRWELVPGVELQVKEGMEEQHYNLIERICKIAGIHFQKSQGKVN